MSIKYNIPNFIKNRPRTRIVCTIGPATSSPAIIERLIRGGMSVARLNLSHGSTGEHQQYVDTVRDLSKKLDISVGILADLPGPKYRTGPVGKKSIILRSGDEVRLVSKSVVGTKNTVSIWPTGLNNDVKTGNKILIDEGAIQLRVIENSSVSILCKVIDGGELKTKKAVTIPGHTSTLGYFTQETLRALDFCLNTKVDFIGLSYIRCAQDLIDVREKIKSSPHEYQLVSKIEIKQAVDNLEEILRETDAVMVARGDLGVELPIERVPGVQKEIIRKANQLGKPVITATQMLESMIENSSPTRAEVTDIHNAVLDGTDAIMLSGETSIGKHPVATVKHMARIAKHAEKFLDYESLRARRKNYVLSNEISVDSSIAHSAVLTAHDLKAKVVLAFTESGSTPARIAGFRPNVPVLSLSPNLEVGNKLSLRWGVLTIVVPRFYLVQEMFYEGSRLALDIKMVKKGELAVSILGMPIGVKGQTNLMRVVTIPEPKPTSTL